MSKILKDHLLILDLQIVLGASEDTDNMADFDQHDGSFIFVDKFK